jgi:hypothetical protein
VPFDTNKNAAGTLPAAFPLAYFVLDRFFQ